MKWLLCLILAALPASAQMFPFPGPGVPSLSSGPPAFSKSCTGSNSGAQTQPCSFSGSVTGGDSIPVFVFWVDPTATFTSVTKTSGTATCGTFSQVGSTVTSGNNHVAQVVGSCSGGGTLTITLTLSAAASSTIYIAAHDVNNLTATTDGSAINTQTGSNSTSFTSGNITTSFSGDYIFGWSIDTGGNCNLTAGSGFTARIGNASNRFSEDQVLAGSGIIAALITSTTCNDVVFTGIMALRHP